jgi:secreted Zn-dependent insulinase-like peptidase
MEVASYVNVEVTTIGNMDGISIIVMSSNYDPEELDFYIEESLGSFENWLNKLTDTQFDNFKNSLLGEML